MTIRSAAACDAAQIAEIYNYYVANSHCTFEVDAVADRDMASRIEHILKKYTFLVYEKDGVVIGYAYAAEYKPRAAYKHSEEISVYVKANLKQKGIGSALYGSLLGEIGETDVHAIIAGISLPNDPSVRLHEKFGFAKVAHFREVGFKFGKWIDVGYWELINDRRRHVIE
jgi:L-amino acid N-acyltransferase YncA